MRSIRVGLAVAALALAACAPKDPNLMRIKATTEGPDEFGILPQRPLELPPTLETASTASLPPPTLGGKNRADMNPMGDAIAALGGREPEGNGTIPAADTGLTHYAARYGTDPNIRQELYDEDLQFRRKHPGRLLERIAGVTTYFTAYARFSLDQQAELERWRKANVPTPSAPPSGEAQENAEEAGY